MTGRHTGGRCFGYWNQHGQDGVRLRVNEPEACIVRRVFEMSASGMSLKGIAITLNAELIPPPRAREGRTRSSWCPTAIRAMNRNEMFVGRSIWKRTRF